jgi:rare lipoprotein A
MRKQTASRRKASRRVSTCTGIGLLGILALSGAREATSAKPPVTVTSETKSDSGKTPGKRHWYQVGFASWYGGGFQGHETASGENYNMTDLTCAHRSLPLGTLIRVTNLVNHKSVVVRVNDRGPFLASRVIDLSYAAAHFLGFDGTAKVRLDILNHGTELADAQSPLPVMGR